MLKKSEMAALTWETGVHSVIIFSILTGHFERERNTVISQDSRTKPGVGRTSILGNWVPPALARGKYPTAPRRKAMVSYPPLCPGLCRQGITLVTLRSQIEEIKQVAITISLRASFLFCLTSQMVLKNPSLQTTLQSHSPLLPSRLNNHLERGRPSGLSKPGGPSTSDRWL